MPANVSVIIVNWNGERFLGRCLAALSAQTVAPTEIILVDNASQDASRTIAMAFPAVRLIAMEQNTGFAFGNNLAIQEAFEQPEWVALLNPDAFPEPNWLEELLVAAQRNPQFDVFGSRLVTATSPTILDGAGDVYHVSGLVWRAGHGMPAAIPTEDGREIFSPCAAAAMYRRDAVLDVGGFDDDYFCYVEDIDLGFRLRLAGYRCLYVPQSVAHHVGSGTTGGRYSEFSVYHGHRNLIWTYVKDMPGILFWLFLPLHLAINLAALAFFTLRGQGKTIWRAKVDAVRGLPRIWRKRQAIQSRRVAPIREILAVLSWY